MAYFVSFAARWFGTPIVHTFHIVTFYDAQQPAIRRKTELWLAKKARPRRVTAPNGFDVKKLQVAGLKQAALLPNGIDMTTWETAGYTEKNKYFTFLAVGRLESQKGFEYLIKAAAILARTAAFRVLIVGDGSQKASLVELAQALHVEKIVAFTGPQDTEQIRTLLAETDAAVLASLYETTPLTLLEAWAASVPVIATRVGILRDAPTDFGAAYVVKPKDEWSLVDAMNYCMADSAHRSEVASKGYKEATKYEWPIIARSAEAIYKGAL
jgi:glycosyltransferase involved in cell wall biosynthesis